MELSQFKDFGAICEQQRLVCIYRWFYRADSDFHVVSQTVCSLRFLITIIIVFSAHKYFIDF